MTEMVRVDASPGNNRPHPHMLSLETKGTSLRRGAGGRKKAYGRAFLGP